MPDPGSPQPCSLPKGLRHLDVATMADAYSAGGLAREAARNAGFDGTEMEEIVLCAVELTTNMVLHAGGGVFRVHVVDDSKRKGVELYGEDRGPGMPEAEAFLADGYSGRGGYGCGLGTLHRLMDRLEVLSPAGPDGGTRVRCSKMTRPDEALTPGSPLDAGAATRPKPGFTFNGDAFVIKTWSSQMLVGIIDGLGHGQFAHKASLSASRYVESHYDLPLNDIFQGVDRACRATRGVVMTLALLDWGRSRASMAAVGNVEMKHFGPSDVSLVARRGFLGSGMRPVEVSHYDWTPHDVLILYSDGMHGKWSWKDNPGLVGMSAQEAAKTLLQAHSRDNDDTTVVVVKGALSREEKSARQGR